MVLFPGSTSGTKLAAPLEVDQSKFEQESTIDEVCEIADGNVERAFAKVVMSAKCVMNRDGGGSSLW